MLSKQSTKRNSKKEKHIMMKQNQELTIIILEQVFSIESHPLPRFPLLLNQIPVIFVSHFFQNPHALVFSLTPLYLSFALFFFSLFVFILSPNYFIALCSTKKVSISTTTMVRWLFVFSHVPCHSFTCRGRPPTPLYRDGVLLSCSFSLKDQALLGW